MTNPYVTSRIAEQRIHDLLDQAHQSRLCRMATKQRRESNPGRNRRWSLQWPVPRPRSAIA
jgi:hypothetical protein